MRKLNIWKQQLQIWKKKSKRIDPVWQFFVILKKEKEWYCKLCKDPRRFKFTTECSSIISAKKHLRVFHNKEFKSIEENEEKTPNQIKISKIDDPKQTKLPFSIDKKYSNNKKYEIN